MTGGAIRGQKLKPRSTPLSSLSSSPWLLADWSKAWDFDSLPFVMVHGFNMIVLRLSGTSGTLTSLSLGIEMMSSSFLLACNVLCGNACHAIHPPHHHAICSMSMYNLSHAMLDTDSGSQTGFFDDAKMCYQKCQHLTWLRQESEHFIIRFRNLRETPFWRTL